MHRACRILTEFGAVVWWTATTIELTTAAATTKWSSAVATDRNHIKWIEFRWHHDDTDVGLNPHPTTQFSSSTRPPLPFARSLWLLPFGRCQSRHSCQLNRITSALYKVSIPCLFLPPFFLLLYRKTFSLLSSDFMGTMKEERRVGENFIFLCCG